MTKKPKEYQATWRERQEAKGLKYLQKWVPKKLWEDIMKLISEYKN